jgi:hypothetical protein
VIEAGSQFAPDHVHVFLALGEGYTAFPDSGQNLVNDVLRVQFWFRF